MAFILPTNRTPCCALNSTFTSDCIMWPDLGCLTWSQIIRLSSFVHVTRQVTRLLLFTLIITPTATLAAVDTGLRFTLLHFSKLHIQQVSQPAWEKLVIHSRDCQLSQDWSTSRPSSTSRQLSALKTVSTSRLSSTSTPPEIWSITSLETCRFDPYESARWYDSFAKGSPTYAVDHSRDRIIARIWLVGTSWSRKH